ncbi:helix-turn-helix domain-containing protein [Micromonospora sp. DT233]|uniref:helix-turn-helix domain-containing protein n=1 Tax=Micromonospora sp. DT233 TaxID=3393432 RepID=UPI003CF0776A
MTNPDLPIGRRVARLRARRGMTQQMLADQLGKSKSWVDKVERGIRTLDRFSVIAEVAAVLRVDPPLLLGRPTPPATTTATTVAAGVDGVRAALARYHPTPAEPGSQVPSARELDGRIGHAWSAYEHADYPRLLRSLPDLLGDAQRIHAADADDRAARLPLVQAYRITASVLVKLGEADLGWLVADRAMTVAAGDAPLAALAALPLGQALRALGRPPLALAVTVPAAHRLADHRPADQATQALRGALLVEAAHAAAGCADLGGVRELLDQAAGAADRVSADDAYRTGFGATAVALARVATAVELGEGQEAVTRHAAVLASAQWRRLPAEHRAAYLLDAARAYLLVGDPLRAGRALVQADRIAPAEVRLRPAARTVIVALARSGPVPADVAALATAVGIGC